MTRVSSAMDSTPGFKGLQKCNQQEDERKDSGQHGSNDGPWQSTPLTVRPNSAHLDSVPKRLCRKREGQKPKQQSTQQHASLTPGRPGTSHAEFPQDDVPRRLEVAVDVPLPSIAHTSGFKLAAQTLVIVVVVVRVVCLKDLMHDDPDDVAVYTVTPLLAHIVITQ